MQAHQIATYYTLAISQTVAELSNLTGANDLAAGALCCCFCFRGRSFRMVYTSPRFHGDIQLCNQLRIRMLHFVQNLQYYLSAEVLGTSWTAFLEQVSKANDLDSVIAAHDTYLKQMLQGALLGNTADSGTADDGDSSADGASGSGHGGTKSGRPVAPLLSKLNQLFSVILRFHDAQDSLQHRISGTVDRLETRAYERSQAERWGVADEDEYNAIAEDEELLRVSYGHCHV